MFTPFGLFNEIHTAKPAFLSVKETASTNKAERIIYGAYRFFPRWGTGVGIHGGLFLAEHYLDCDILIANDDHLVSEGIQLQYDTGTLRVLAEAVLGSMNPASGSSVQQLGWFIQPSYRMDSGLTPYTRLEFFDLDRDVDDDRGFSLVLGFNYETSGGLTFKLEENYFKGGAESAGLRDLPGTDGPASERHHHCQPGRQRRAPQGFGTGGDLPRPEILLEVAPSAESKGKAVRVIEITD